MPQLLVHAASGEGLNSRSRAQVKSSQHAHALNAARAYICEYVASGEGLNSRLRMYVYMCDYVASGEGLNSLCMCTRMSVHMSACVCLFPPVDSTVDGAGSLLPQGGVSPSASSGAR